ncbi:MAG: nucleotidyltransferase family protein [Rhodospirillales bacterium]|nr:nucleotidyltransferase family protein [Rhodospirillales bacterium]
MGDPKHIAVIVLAAGQSSRMGDTNKLLAEVQGKTMLRHAVDAALGSRAVGVVVVTGFEADRINKSLNGLAVEVVHNEDFADGMRTSLKWGLAALSDDIGGAIICLADMPGVKAADLDNLISAFDPHADRAVCVASYDGKRGNPVLWSQAFFSEIMELTGDVGARALLQKHAPVVHEVEMASDAVIQDVDTPDALALTLNLTR